MDAGRIAKIGLRAATVATLAFIYLPILIIFMYAFNADPLQRWPITGYTIEWIGRAWADEGIRSAFFASLRAAIGATAVALVLGSLISEFFRTAPALCSCPIGHPVTWASPRTSRISGRCTKKRSVRTRG